MEDACNGAFPLQERDLRTRAFDLPVGDASGGEGVERMAAILTIDNHAKRCQELARGLGRFRDRPVRPRHSFTNTRSASLDGMQTQHAWVTEKYLRGVRLKRTVTSKVSVGPNFSAAKHLEYHG